ncbi:MAG: NAD(P)-dependent oxidoreductase [Candidatus Helarchaeota archaeon]|nr:NAD(P)-dependent oxidoreductase [Candidatus Helarchaeota archaeon]
MGKAILITGSAGSYGSALVKVGREWGYDVYHTDIREPDQPDKKFIKADISDKESIKPLGELELDAVIHCAGVIDITATELHKKVHLEGTENLIDLLGDKVKVWVTVSSAAIHGGTEEDIAITEDKPRTLEDSYTRTKAEEYDLTLEKLPNKSIIIEPALIYDEKNRYMFKEIVEIAAMGVLFVLVERGSFKLNMVHPLDIAPATLLLMERGEFGQSYIVCDDYPVTMRDLADLTAQVTHGRFYNPKRSIGKDFLKNMMRQMDRLMENMPSLEGMEPMGTMMEEMGIELGGFEMPMDPSYMMTHHRFSNKKAKEITKKNAKQWRILEKTTNYFPNGWYPEINPFFEIPKVIKFWTEQNPPVIKKKYELPDMLEFFYDYISGMF